MSDIDTGVADSLKVLDPRRPIREADMLVVSLDVRFRGQTGKHLVPLSLTGSDGHSAAFTRLAYRP